MCKKMESFCYLNFSKVLHFEKVIQGNFYCLFSACQF